MNINNFLNFVAFLTIVTGDETKLNGPKCLRYYRNRNLRGVRELDLFPLTGVKDCMKYCIKQKGKCRAIISYKYGKEERTCITLNGTSADPGVRLIEEQGAALFEIKNECWNIGKLPMDLPGPPAFPKRKATVETEDALPVISPPSVSSEYYLASKSISEESLEQLKTEWGEWASWAQCSAKCGQGTQRRLRLCTNIKKGSTCDPDSSLPVEFQEQECYNEDNCGTWDAWSEWTHCSTSCDNGKQQRTRSCSTGHDTDCRLDASTEVRECFVTHCFESSPVIPVSNDASPSWGSWSDWASCSVTCNVGRTGRLRICSVPDSCSSTDGTKDNLQFQTDSRPCFKLACSNQLPTTSTLPIAQPSFSTKNPSSSGQYVSLFPKTRIFSPGPNNDTKSDIRLEVENAEPPNVITTNVITWLHWSEWSQCSVSCGSGQRTRGRVCPVDGICLGSPENRQVCYESDCPKVEGSLHEADSITMAPPTDNVPSITQALEELPRQSIAWVADKPSIPDSHAFTFPFPRLQTVLDNLGKSDNIPTPKPIPFGPGIAAQRLKKLFLQRNRNRNRFTDSQKSQVHKLVAAINRPESTESWDYSISQDAVTESAIQEENSWEDWSTWAVCSVTCGVGQQSRTRTCRIESGCSSATGLLLSETVSKYCHQSACVSPGFEPSRGSWTEWKACSATCGKGVQIRKRKICPTCNHYDLEHKVCTLGPCPKSVSHWSVWGPWSECDAPCAKRGQRYRERVCFSAPGSGCPGNDSLLEACTSAQDSSQCSIVPDGNIKSSTNSSTYVSILDYDLPEPTKLAYASSPLDGFEFKFDIQNIIPNLNKRYDGVDTSTPSNPFSTESTWASWTDCSATCGTGTKLRRKSCGSTESGSGECDGNNLSEAEECHLGACPCAWQSWSKWSQCSHPCHGKKVRTSRCVCPEGDPTCVSNKKRDTESCYRRRCRFSRGRNAVFGTRLDLVELGRRGRGGLSLPLDNQV